MRCLFAVCARHTPLLMLTPIPSLSRDEAPGNGRASLLVARSVARWKTQSPRSTRPKCRLQITKPPAWKRQGTGARAGLSTKCTWPQAGRARRLAELDRRLEQPGLRRVDVVVARPCTSTSRVAAPAARQPFGIMRQCAWKRQHAALDQRDALAVDDRPPPPNSPPSEGTPWVIAAPAARRRRR